MSELRTFRNFRDMGGLICPDGKRIRRFKLFRAPTIAPQNQADWDFLDDYRKSIRQTEAAELAFRFYHEAAVGCGSYVYPYLTAAAKDLIKQCFASSIRILGKDPFLPPLEETLAALRDRDAETACGAFRKICRQWEEIYTSTFSE